MHIHHAIRSPSQTLLDQSSYIREFRLISWKLCWKSDDNPDNNLLGPKRLGPGYFWLIFEFRWCLFHQMTKTIIWAIKQSITSVKEVLDTSSEHFQILDQNRKFQIEHANIVYQQTKMRLTNCSRMDNYFHHDITVYTLSWMKFGVKLGIPMTWGVQVGDKVRTHHQSTMWTSHHGVLSTLYYSQVHER